MVMTTNNKNVCITKWSNAFSTLKKLILGASMHQIKSITKVSHCTQKYKIKANELSKISINMSYFIYLSRGLLLPRVKSILTLLTATSSSFSITPPFFCKIKIWNNTYKKVCLAWYAKNTCRYTCQNAYNIHCIHTWEQTISCAVTSLKCSSLSFGTAYSLQNWNSKENI